VAKPRPQSENASPTSGGGTDAANGAAEYSGRAALDNDKVDTRPRILAYSDSDSDVESHYKRVKDTLLPDRQEAQTDEEDEGVRVDEDEDEEQQQQQQAAVAAAAAAAETAARQSSSLVAALGVFGRFSMQQLTPGVFMGALALGMLKRFRPEINSGAEVAAVAMSFFGSAASAVVSGTLELSTRLALILRLELLKSHCSPKQHLRLKVNFSVRLFSP
jgi:hypothetical protein